MKLMQDRIQTILNEGLLDQVYGGASFMAFKGGKEWVYAQAGCKDKEMGTALTRDTIFRVYSMSKPITAAAAMILVERGELDMFSPVSAFLPGFKNQRYMKDGKLLPVEREMMVADLMNMTSGLVYPGEDTAANVETAKVFDAHETRRTSDMPMDTVALCNALGQCPLLFTPGSAWCYGTSADVLGAVIELVSGKKFGAFLRDEIFVPLGMDDTGFYVPGEKQARLAAVYEQENGVIVKFTKRHLAVGGLYELEPSFESGGAGLVSTMDDYMKFAQMLLYRGVYRGRKVLSAQSVKMMTSPQLNDAQIEAFWDRNIGYSYGRLMRIRTQMGTAPTLGSVGEYGWGGWLGTEFINDPEQGLSILMMTQRKDTNSTTHWQRMKNALYGAL